MWFKDRKREKKKEKKRISTNEYFEHPFLTPFFEKKLREESIWIREILERKDPVEQMKQA